LLSRNTAYDARIVRNNVASSVHCSRDMTSAGPGDSFTSDVADMEYDCCCNRPRFRFTRSPRSSRSAYGFTADLLPTSGTNLTPLLAFVAAFDAIDFITCATVRAVFFLRRAALSGERGGFFFCSPFEGNDGADVVSWWEEPDDDDESTGNCFSSFRYTDRSSSLALRDDGGVLVVFSS